VAAFLHPGVYVQEVPSAVKPIEGVSTSTAAFIGVADKGPVPGTLLPTKRPAQPVLVTGFTDAVGSQWTYDYDGAARTADCNASPSAVT